MKLLEAYGDKFKNAIANAVLSEIIYDINVVEAKDLNYQIPTKDAEKTIVVGSGMGMDECIKIANFTGLKHFVNEDRSDFFYGLFCASILIKQPQSFVQNPITFFRIHMNADLKPDEAREAPTERIIKVDGIDQKYDALSDIQKELNKNKMTRVFADEAQIALDELMINAFYQGPGTHAATVKAPSEKQPSEKSLEVFMIYNSRRLIVGCIDQYGSLNVSNLVNHLYNRSNESLLAVRENSRTGGLGLTYIIEHSATFYAVCGQGVNTMVATMFPLREGGSMLESYPKNLHLCEYGSGKSKR